MNCTPKPRNFPEVSLLFQLPPPEEMLIEEPNLYIHNNAIVVFGDHSARDFKVSTFKWDWGRLCGFLGRRKTQL